MNSKVGPRKGPILFFNITSTTEIAVIRVNPSSINDLLALKAAGAPVTLTSHPGNASLYKLTLWQCGIPEHLWDVTCCVADANNWPMFRLQSGQAELLVCEEQYQKIMKETNSNSRFVTAYQYTKSGERLGRVHVRAIEACFPETISSCSRLLLSEIDKVKEMFAYLAETRREVVFTRFITPDGILMPIRESGIRSQDLVDSFARVLQELDHLLFSDKPITTQGGACYDGVMIPLSTILAQYWQTGWVDRYDISGPDMIHYATRQEHQEKMSEMLGHLHQWNPRLVPPNIVIRIFPGTVARVGHIPGHVSENVMTRKIHALRYQSQLSSSHKRHVWEIAKEDERYWPMQIKASKEHYFSQHDLLINGGSLVIDDFWKNIPLNNMWETLTRANALLRLK